MGGNKVGVAAGTVNPDDANGSAQKRRPMTGSAETRNLEIL